MWGSSLGVGGRWSADPGDSAKDGRADRRQFTLLARSAPLPPRWVVWEVSRGQQGTWRKQTLWGQDRQDTQVGLELCS